MALATSMPLLGELTMKFSRHSLQDPFQLPASFNFYHCFEQAKDIAFYNRFFATPQRGEDTIFEFTGSVSGNYGLEKASSVREKPQETRISLSNERRDPINTKVTAYANPTHGSTCPTGRTLTETSREESDEGASSDEEELVGYFSGNREHCDREEDDKNTEETSRISHNRKRSIELDESFDVKRCCRPRLNFEKMQRGDDCTREIENNTNYFRPISALDL